MKNFLGAAAVVLASGALLLGCSSSPKTVAPAPTRYSEELAMHHFLEGSMLDQKQDYAKAILEYQDALRYKQDPAIYHAIAKDYSAIGKNEMAMQMGREAARLSPENRTYHESLAQIYLNAFELDGAITEYENVVRVDSFYTEGWLNLARLWQVKDQGKALDIYRKIIDRFGPSADAYFQMAHIYASLNKFDKAAEALKGILSVDPGSFEVKKLLGDTYLREDSVNEALKIYDELSELHPENLEVRASMAHAYLVKQDYEHAGEQFEKVLQKDTLSVENQLKFGQIFDSFIEKDSAVAPYAIKLFQKVRSSYPTDWRPYLFLGRLYNIVRDDSLALVNFQKVKELATWNADGWVGVAAVYYDKGRFDEAIGVLTEAKHIIPEEFRIHLLLGISYQRLHQTIEAAETLEKALLLNDKSVDALTALGLVYDEMKRHEDSDSMYERAIRIDSKNHLLLNNYGYSLAERGIELQRALTMSREAVRQQPLNTSYLDTYGWIFYQMGQYDEAERYVKKAIDLGSTSPVIQEHLGDIYFKLSQKDKAMEYWKKALEVDKSNTALKDKIQRGSL